MLNVKVQSATATVNTTPPLVYGHLLVKRKKLKVRKEWGSFVYNVNFPRKLESKCCVERKKERKKVQLDPNEQNSSTVQTQPFYL